MSSKAPLAQLIAAVDRTARAAGRLGMAAILLLLALMLLEVIARYGFNAPTVWGNDLATMTNAAIFLLGAAVTLQQGQHVRIDFPATRLPPLLQNLIQATLYLAGLAPLLLLLVWQAWRLTLAAWRSGEVDLAGAWQVPVWPMRALVAACLTLLFLQVLAEAAKHLAAWRNIRALGLRSGYRLTDA